MSMRMDHNGRTGAGVANAPRGASRIAPPPVKRTPRQWPSVNWQLLSRLLYPLLVLTLLVAAAQAWRELVLQLDRPIAQVLGKASWVWWLRPTSWSCSNSWTALASRVFCR